MLTPNEIRMRAHQFAERWADATKENAEAQTFWNEFLQVFGIDRRRVAKFESKVDGLEKGSGRGRIDLLWPGLFMAEHKSKGRNLEDATAQALEYVAVLEEHERPEWVAVSDFGQVRLQEVSSGEAHQFALADLPRNVERFAFLNGKQIRRLAPSDPVNVKAAQQMGKLHNLLEDSGYKGHALELLLVRLLFLLFADDTGLWEERGLFQDLLADHTRSDGDNTGAMLARLFQTLDTPRDERQTNLAAHLAVFPYVNGELFSEHIALADFSPKMRQMLLDAGTLDWGAVSPAIFGSMFQAVMDEKERRDLGAHYTSEENILKALGPLFLDELHAMRKAAKGNKARLQQFLDLLPRLRFLDPACGSGNFLLLAYRELRRLELDALVESENQGDQPALAAPFLLRVNVGQFYGIEYDEFPAQIARVAMWLADHQANIEASNKLGRNFVNLPLTQAAHILKGDALAADWASHLNLSTDAAQISRVYVVGNPPFIGSSLVTAGQRQQLLGIFQGVQDAGKLDYVAGWYLKAARLLNHVTRTWPQMQAAAALVSTNSVTQGEQVAPLWGSMLRDQNMTITAAHQTFKWKNEAPGQAAVHCVIIQFQPAASAPKARRMFSYSSPKAAPVETPATFINAYLADGPDVLVTKRRQPFLPNVQRVVYGNKPVDGSRDRVSKGAADGNLIIATQSELDALLKAEPGARKFIKPLVGAEDFLHGGHRWTLWLPDAQPHELAKLPKVLERVARVKKLREASRDIGARKLAERPAEFRDTRLPARYIVIPRHTSENRDYVPFGYLDSETVVNDSVFMLPDADLLTFGLLSSAAHMAWLHSVGGKLESRYRYSSDLVYNTFPWPDRSKLKPAQIKAVEAAAQAVLDARAKHPGSTLAELYEPLTMPRDLRAAHTALDRAVDALYGIKSGSTEAQRLAHLLGLYQAAAPTLASQAAAPAKKGRKKASA